MLELQESQSLFWFIMFKLREWSWTIDKAASISIEINVWGVIKLLFLSDINVVDALHLLDYILALPLWVVGLYLYFEVSTWLDWNDLWLNPFLFDFFTVFLFNN